MPNNGNTAASRLQERNREQGKTDERQEDGGAGKEAKEETSENGIGKTKKRQTMTRAKERETTSFFGQAKHGRRERLCRT